MQSPAVLDLTALPSTIGSYQIDGKIGEGAAGTVYRAHSVDDADEAKRVALKVLKPEAMTEPAMLACFQFEGRVLTRLQHPGILRVYKTGMDDGYMYTAMEFIDGYSFDAYLAGRKKLTVRETIHVGRQVAEALDYLHSHGFAHRDIKPANLMLEHGGRIVLFDFGTVFRIKDGVDYESGVFGTPAFLAPEQIRAEKKIDGRADLYALGIVLYHMAVGRKPFYGSPGETLEMHLHQPPPPPSQFGRIPAALEAVILKAIAKRPEDRYQTGAALAEALTHVAQNLPPPQPSIWQRLLSRLGLKR